MLNNPKTAQNNSNLAVYSFQGEESKEQMWSLWFSARVAKDQTSS